MFLELAEKQGRFENGVTYRASVHMSRQCCGAAIKKLRGRHLLEGGNLTLPRELIWLPIPLQP